MARLTRKNIKVFAGNATNNGVFGSLQAENPVTTTNVEQIQSLPAWSVGWNSATMTSEKLPPLEEFQGIQYVTTYQQAYLMQEGMPEWASTVTYYKGSLTKEVTSNGFRIYCSLTNDNTNNLLSDTSNWKKVMDSSDLYAFDNAVVHIAGTETITGSKTFSSQIIASAGNGIQIKGTNHYYVMKSGGSPYEGCSLLLDNDLTKKAFSADASKMTIGSSAIPAYANVPSGVTTSTSNEQIATCGWVNTVGNRVVHTSGNETIAGTKTFQSDPMIKNGAPRLYISDPNQTKGTANGTQWSAVEFQDTNGARLGTVRQLYDSNKLNRVELLVEKANASGDNSQATMTLFYPASGNPYAMAPASDAENSILTTVNKSKSSNGYYKLGNGLIIQWGRTTDTTNQTKTITFPVAFTSNNYSITATANNQFSGYSYDGVTGISDKTTTSCKVYSYYASRTYDWIAIGY